MQKKVISLLISIICILNTLTVFADYSESCADFLGRYYDVFDYGFDDGADALSCGTVRTDIAGSPVLELNGGAELLSGSGGFAGKTYFSFELMADSIRSFEFIINSAETFDMQIAPSDSESMSCSINSEKICSLLIGHWTKFEFFINTFSEKAGVLVTSPTGERTEREFDIKDADILSALNISADGDVYMDNIKMSRGIKSFDGKILITGGGKYVSAFCENPENGTLYIAHLRDGKLLGCAASENSFGSPYAEVCLLADMQKGDVFKAFLWDGKLAPKNINAALNSENLSTAEVTVSGSISAKPVKLGDSTDFDVSFADGYSGKYKITVYGESGGEVQLDGNTANTVSYTPQSTGKHTAFLYAEKDGRAALAGKCEFTVAENMAESAYFLFPADRAYYVHGGSRISYDGAGYIPLMLDGHIYLSAERIGKMTGIEIKNGAVQYLGETLALFDEKSGTAVDGSGFSVSIKYGLYSFGDICSLIGFESAVQDDVLCVTRGGNTDIFDYRELLFDAVTEEKSFGYYDWSTNTNGGGAYDADTGIYTAYAVQSSVAGHAFRTLDKGISGEMYEVSFEVKYSDDAVNVMPWTGMFTTKNGSFANLYTGVGTGEGKAGEWTKVRSYFTRRTMDSDVFDSATAFYVGIKRKSDVPSSGSLMFRNVYVREVSITADSTECEISCDKYAAWHTLGETVRYRAKDKNADGFESISGVIYDSDNNKVYEKTVSSRKFAADGWSWTPDRLGYYEAEFYGTRSDGSQSLLVNAYSENYSSGYMVYKLERRSFAVVSGAAKPMSERSDLFMLSDSALSEDNVKLADAVGFSGIRIHGVSWGDTAGTKGFHKASGRFDWTAADTQINNVKKYGFKNIIANIFATPTWAVSRNDVTSAGGYNSVGMWDKNCYPPDDPSVAAEGFGAYAERYRDVLSGIEIWNEPTYGNTAFWYQGNRSNTETEQDFVNLTKTAAQAIREKAPGVKIYTAGFNQADKFFRQLLNHDGYAEFFDGVTCHGRYSDPEVYQKILAENNLSDKEVLNSEGYYYAYYDVGVPKNYKENNMVLYMQYLKHIKLGVSKITHFSLFDNTADERRVYTRGWNCAGLFRDYPYIEPHQGAVAAYNLFETLGKDISYKDEYSFSNGTRAVSLESDGKTVIYFWNTSNQPYYMPEELADCAGTDGSITDFEGNRCDSGGKLREMRMYCITNADEAAVKKLVSAPDSALNSEYIAPYYTCDDGKGGGEVYTPIEGYYTKGALFDRTSFADTDVEAVYNSEGAVWLAIDDNEQDITAKYAVSFDEYGMYLKTVVNDNYYVNHANTVNTMLNHDCVRFAVDCYGRQRNSERSEFFAGCAAISPVLYKYYAADRNEALVENWSPSGTNLSNRYINIVRSDDDKTTTYRVFVPYQELYPLNMAEENGEIKFALSVTDRDGGVTKGYLSFGMGLSEEGSPQVWKYMNLKLKE